MILKTVSCNLSNMKFPRVCRIAMVAAMFFTASLIAETVSVSSLDLKQMTVGWSDAKTDLGVAGKPISIGGKQFTHGAGTHAASNFRVDLGGKATRFTAEVGVDDSAGNQGSVEFIVMGDGKVMWQSGVLAAGQAAVPVDVDLAGVTILGLRVRDGGEGTGNDHADWADAKITIKDGAAKPLALPP